MLLRWFIEKLQNDGLIKGAYIVYGRIRYAPLSVWVPKVSISTYGIDILKQKLKLNYVIGEEAVGNSSKWVGNN